MNDKKKPILYADRLPRRLRPSEHFRRQALTSKGQKCRREARWEQDLHGHSDIHPHAWFAVKACDQHVNHVSIKLGDTLKEKS